jgi:hypothetical protein
LECCDYCRTFDRRRVCAKCSTWMEMVFLY